jgi:hypothetical protein
VVYLSREARTIFLLMRIVEVLKIEENKEKQVLLFKEGMFWRAYGHSAFLFSQHIKAYNLTKKYYKM